MQKRVMSNIILPILIVAVGAYAALCLSLFFMQSKLLYYPAIPSRNLTASPADINLEYDTVTLITGDHVKLHGWFIPAAHERGTLLFFHGNAGNISHRLDSLKIFHELGLSTLIFDYRGYGRSQGTISELGTYLDAEAAWKYLTESRKIPAQAIVVFGRSLGAAIGAYIAVQQKPAGLILESAFTSVPDLAARLYPFFPVRLLSRFHYNTEKFLHSVSCPVLIIHSSDDEIIPYENGLQLYKRARNPKSFLELHGDHNQGFLVSSKLYKEGLQEFVTASLAAAKNE